ncbi:coiled-coil domain-containing protein 171 isoform X2 [Archocentrus centrarchus]|uniref:coiled-coil domain-containing protein 171 isoform X2 n=1 Tax=Archocentrus centrarchus TaxID=63155 RepID=UPI0011EA11B8|nr:coiled-coil domain-containing protein 171 isoform X2 [Archocentrus centrarchus]
MLTGAAQRRRQTDRGEREDSGKSRAEPRGIEERAAGSRARSSVEEKARSHLMFDPTQQVKQAAGDGGRRAERKGEEEDEWEERGRGKDRSRGDGRRSGRTRRAASEGCDGGEEWRRLRWRVNDLEKEKLQLKASHNQEVCGLQAELTRLRSSVERGEAQRVELQYQLTLSRRDAERVAELSRDKRSLTERATELQQTVEELQKALDITRHAREEDQHALQQEVEERERLIQSFSSENQRLHRLLQDQEVALEESERRMAEVQKEQEKEAEVKRRRANELKQLMDREERGRREKELLEQRVKSLQLNIEAERAAHLETKFNSEIVQLRVRDLEAVVAAERSGQQEAQSTLELLRAQFREVENAYSQERERSGSTERALERLQAEYEQSKCDMSMALETEKKTTSDLSEKLEEEQRRHADTHSLLEQAVQRQCDTEEEFVACVKQIRDALQQHTSTGEHSMQPAEDDGKQSLSAKVLQLLRTTLSSDQQRLLDADKQVQDLLLASEKLQGENQTLRELTSDQRRQIDESQQEMLKLKEAVSRLSQESSDWSIQTQSLEAELQREREERVIEMEKEREERTAEVQRITEHYHKESTAHLSFLYCLYQRLLAGCVLLDQSQSILGNFTWEELCDVMSEQVDQLTSDLRKANEKITHLQSACNKKSVRVRELQRSQECVLSRLEESARMREEEWSRQHTHTVRGLQSELQLCRSQCNSLRDHASSLEQRCSSLTSDLSQLRGLLSRSRKESSSFFLACALLGGALRHSQNCVRTLSEQKKLLSRQLAEREQLEEEVRRLVDALEGEKDEEKERERMRRVVRRWRKSVCVVLAVGRWWSLARKTTVLFRLERGGGAPAVCVCGEEDAASQEDVCEGRDGVAAPLFRSKRLSCTILTSMSDLQGTLMHSGSSPPILISAASSGLSRLLDHLLDQSQSSLSSCSVHKETLIGRLRLGLSRLTTSPQPDMKSLVSILQQHFLVFSQRLHSAEVERRGLRLEVANLKRGLRKETRMVPDKRFHSVCAELRQALSREQEAQVLIQEQCNQLHTLQRRVDRHAAEQAETQRTLNQTTQVLSEARQEVSRKERSLRILGKHLSGVQKEKKQVEQRLQRAEDELRDATRRQDRVVSCMKAAEMSCKQFRDSLVQSQHSLTAKPHPLLLPLENLELSGTESIMGDPEVAACQSFLSIVSQLCHTCSSRIDWLEQEVSAHRSHVTALRSELQDACLRDNLAFVPVSEFPETFPVADLETLQPVPLCDLSGNLMTTKSPAPSQSKPACSHKASCTPPSPFCKATVGKTKANKATKKNRGHTKSGGRK